MYKIRIKNSPSDKETGQQENYGLVRNLAATQVNPEQVTVNNKMGAVPREEANIEVEGGESVIGDVNKDGIMELMHFTGKRHHEGGVPVNIPEGSFIFSDTKSLTIKDPEILEKVFNLTPRKKGYTPAEISKKFEINQYVQILKAENIDEMAKRSAAEMLRKNKQKLGILAFIQESMKGFPDGIPTIAEEVLESLGISPDQIVQAANQQIAQEQQQQMMQQQMMAQQGQAPQMQDMQGMEGMMQGMPQEQPYAPGEDMSQQEILDNAAMMAAQQQMGQPPMVDGEQDMQEEPGMAMGGTFMPELKRYQRAGTTTGGIGEEELRQLLAQREVLLNKLDLLKSDYYVVPEDNKLRKVPQLKTPAIQKKQALEIAYYENKLKQINNIISGAGTESKPINLPETQILGNRQGPIMPEGLDDSFDMMYDALGKNPYSDYAYKVMQGYTPPDTTEKYPGIGTIKDLENFTSQSRKHKLAANYYLSALRSDNPDILITAAKELERRTDLPKSDAESFDIPMSVNWWPGSDQDKISENWPHILRERALKLYNDKQKDILTGSKTISMAPDGSILFDENQNPIYRERTEDEMFTPEAVAKKLQKLIEHYDNIASDENYSPDLQAQNAAKAAKFEKYLEFINRNDKVNYKNWFENVLKSEVINTDNNVGNPITDEFLPSYDELPDGKQTVFGMLDDINAEYDAIKVLNTKTGKTIDKGTTHYSETFRHPFKNLINQKLVKPGLVSSTDRPINIFNSDIKNVETVQKNTELFSLISDPKESMSVGDMNQWKNKNVRKHKNYPQFYYWYSNDPNETPEWYKRSIETGADLELSDDEVNMMNQEETSFQARKGNPVMGGVKFSAAKFSSSDESATQSILDKYKSAIEEREAKEAAETPKSPVIPSVSNASNTNTVKSKTSTQPASLSTTTESYYKVKPKAYSEDDMAPEKKFGGSISHFDTLIKKQMGRYKFGGTIDKYGRILKTYELAGEVTDEPEIPTDVGDEPKTSTKPQLVKVKDMSDGNIKYQQTWPDGTIYTYVKTPQGKLVQARNTQTGQDYTDEDFEATRGNSDWVTPDNLNAWEKKNIGLRWNNDVAEYVKTTNSANQLSRDKEVKDEMWKQYQIGINDPNYIMFTQKKGESRESENLKVRQGIATSQVRKNDKGQPVSMLADIKASIENPDDLMKYLISLDVQNARLKSFNYAKDKVGTNAPLTQDQVNAMPASERSKYQPFVGKTNIEAARIIANNPDVLGDLDFDKGHVEQAAYLAYSKALMNNSALQNRASFKATGENDEVVWGMQRQISGVDRKKTNTTLEQRTGYIAVEPKKEDKIKKKDEEIKKDSVKKSAYYCVEYVTGEKRIETVTYDEGSKPIPPNAPNIKAVVQLQSPNDTCSEPYTNETKQADQSRRWFAPDVVNFGTALGMDIPKTPPTLRQLPINPLSGYTLKNPITQIAGVTGLTKQQQDLAMNTMDAATAFAATSGLGYDQLAQQIGGVENQNIDTVNQYFDRIAGRQLQADQYNTQARRQFDVDNAVYREELARDTNAKNAQIAKMYGQGFKNMMNDNAMRVAYPNAWHVDRSLGTFGFSGVGRDPLMPDTYYSPVSGRGSGAEDVSNQAIGVYNDAERMFLQQNPGQTAEAKKHAAAMQKYYLDQQNKSSSNKRRSGNAQADYNSGLPSAFRNGGMYGFGAYYTNPFEY